MSLPPYPVQPRISLHQSPCRTNLTASWEHEIKHWPLIEDCNGYNFRQTFHVPHISWGVFLLQIHGNIANFYDTKCGLGYISLYRKKTNIYSSTILALDLIRVTHHIQHHLFRRIFPTDEGFEIDLSFPYLRSSKVDVG